MSLIDFTAEIKKHNKAYALKSRKNPKLTLQHPFRALLCGPSGCGKTSAALNLLFNPDLKVHFDEIYVCAKDLSEPCYEYLRDKLQGVEDYVRENYDVPEDYKLFRMCTDIAQLPHPDELDPLLMNLIIVDDQVNEKNQELIKEHYLRGRKRNCSYMYLSQSYFDTPKLVKKNCNYFLLWKLTGANDVRNVGKDQAGDIGYELFNEVYQAAITEPYSFLLIDKATPRDHLKYRKNFDGGAVLTGAT
jgi:hypothetical protein